MFDPTVFDNLKVVVEGDLYELDLEGRIRVIDRKDQVDLANMSRTFSMSITRNKETQAKIILSSDLENIAGELLQKNRQPGCKVKISFFRRADQKMELPSIIDAWKEELVGIWGKHWSFSFSITEKYNSEEASLLKAEVSFGRLFYEENVDDLRELILYFVQSVE